MSFYPNINSETVMTLSLIEKFLDKDPKFLDHDDCPYPAEVKSFFSKRAQAMSAPAVNIFEDEDDVDVMDKQIQKVLSDLDSMGAAMVAAEVNERIAYFRAKTTLVEKLMNLKERVFNLKELQEFRATVLQGLDDICDKDQITTFMKRLDGMLGVGETE